MRAVFEDLGCSACAAKAMVEDQGIDTLNDLCSVKDGNVETLCKNVKGLEVQLGETIEEPTWDTWSVKRLR